MQVHQCSTPYSPADDRPDQQNRFVYELLFFIYLFLLFFFHSFIGFFKFTLCTPTSLTTTCLLEQEKHGRKRGGIEKDGEILRGKCRGRQMERQSWERVGSFIKLISYLISAERCAAKKSIFSSSEPTFNYLEIVSRVFGEGVGRLGDNGGRGECLREERFLVSKKSRLPKINHERFE